MEGPWREIIQERQQEEKNLVHILSFFSCGLLVRKLSDARKHSEFHLPRLSLVPLSLRSRSLQLKLWSLAGCGAAPLCCHQVSCHAGGVGVHTARCACMHFSLITLVNSISVLMPGEARVLSESQKETASELVCGPVLAFLWSPVLLPNLNSVHSKGHKSAVVRIYYEEINIYQVAFEKVNNLAKKNK